MDSVVLNVKVVPGSSRDQVAGRYGDGIKIQTSAPPEAGKANAAVIEILAEFLGVRNMQIELISSPSNPKKQFRISHFTPQRLIEKLSTLG